MRPYLTTKPQGAQSNDRVAGTVALCFNPAVKKQAALLLAMVLLVAAAPVQAQRWQELFNGRNLDGWKPLFPDRPNDWQVASSVPLNSADPKLLEIIPWKPGGRGVLVNGAKGKTVNLITIAQHADVEAEVEFVVPKDSNSGVYFMGLYEVQILDSFGKPNDKLEYGDCGGIYCQWIDNKPVGGEPPRVNASKAPGQWQSFHVWFRAPRFDAGGKKIENARFIKVIHNGVVVHENYEVGGRTRAHMEKPEAATGPLMIQGDHGPVAFRIIRIRPLK
jgi:hypothetical protein